MVPAATPFRELIHLVARSTETLFPVVDRQGRLTGIFTLRDLRLALVGSDWGPLVLADDLAHRPVLTVTPEDNLHTALRRMTELNVDELPVVDPEDPTRLLGLLSRRQLTLAYTSLIESLRSPRPRPSENPADRARSSRRLETSGAAPPFDSPQIGGDRGADLVQQRAGAVLLAPAVDVVPVDPVALHGDHIADIVPVLGPIAQECPVELGHDHVLRSRHPDLAIQHDDLLSPPEPLLIVRIIIEEKELDLERRPDHVGHVPASHRHGLEAHLGVDMKPRTEESGNIDDGLRTEFDHEIRVLASIARCRNNCSKPSRRACKDIPSSFKRIDDGLDGFFNRQGNCSSRARRSRRRARISRT